MAHHFFFRLLLLFLIFAMLGSTGWTHDLADIKKAGVLRHLAIPYANFYTGREDGLDVEMIKGFAEALGVRYKLIETSWKDVFGDLTGHNARREGKNAKLLDKVPVRGDLVANGMTILGWRTQVVNFSEPTFPSGVWLIARADSPLTPITPTGKLKEDIKQVKTQLHNHGVLALANTCLDPGLYNMNATGADIRLQPKERKLNEMVPAVLNNDADSTLLDVPDALIALERWPGQIKVIGPISDAQLMGVAFRKDTPKLREAFNTYFKRIRTDGTYNRLVKKYYPAVFRYSADFFTQPAQ
ncbi:MAG TPA: transporter substrate-binding domain-containing protein [Desulfobulbus sp.]|nr:transporter substrate-binding domain-containing protein [Desulfobulbus sp.]